MSAKTPNLAEPLKFVVSPGPGNYNPNFETLYRGFSYTMRSRPNTSKPDTYPGPGNYNVRLDQNIIGHSYR